MNYEHRDSKRLHLIITEEKSGTQIASVVQEDLEPGNLGPGAKDMVKRLQLYKQTIEEDE